MQEPTAADIDQVITLEWARMKTTNQFRDEEFTTRDREMFGIGFAACLVVVARENGGL